MGACTNDEWSCTQFLIMSVHEHILHTLPSPDQGLQSGVAMLSTYHWVGNDPIGKAIFILMRGPMRYWWATALRYIQNVLDLHQNRSVSPSNTSLAPLECYDTSTLLTQVVPLAAPGGSTVISPLSTLLVSLKWNLKPNALSLMTLKMGWH
jgi:hypothetical protein